ncbi:MAG: glycosyltransferase [Oscillospiraceae bacterium]|nr:glycosyltransferase [Oscillospiraceae bacterium]
MNTAREEGSAVGSPLRIALFIDIFFPNVDGVVRTVDAYARNLQAMGHDVFVVAPREAKSGEDEKLPYRVYRQISVKVPGFTANVPLAYCSRELREAFEAAPPDIIHVHSPFLTSRLALQLGKKYHVPVFATFHSKYYDDALNVTHSKLLAKLMVRHVVRFFSRADHVWACSAMTAKTLRGYGYKGVIHVMENGVDLKEAPQNLEELRQTAVERFSLPTDRPLLLFVGQLIWQKNLRLILDSLKRLADRGEAYELLVVGEGYHGEAIQTYCRELGLEKRVHFLGKIADRKLLFGVYAASDLMFFPSLYDNAPLVLREAALAGVPSLLAAGSNAAEVVEDGVNGYLAAPDAESMERRILEIFSDSEARRQIGQKAKQSIPISWSKIVERVVTAYRSGSKQGHIYTLEAEQKR